MTDTNPVPPKIRKAVVRGLKKADGQEKISLKYFESTDRTSLYVEPGNSIDPQVLSALYNIGYQPSGMVVREWDTRIPLTEIYRSYE